MASGAQPRPLGVVVISAVQMLFAFFMLLISYQMAHGEALGIASREVLGALASRAPYLALLAILPAALSIGLYLMANWARIFVLATCGLSLVECIIYWAHWSLSYAHEAQWHIFNIDVYLQTIPFYVLVLRTAAYVWVVVYLLRPKVVRAFREAY